LGKISLNTFDGCQKLLSKNVLKSGFSNAMQIVVSIKKWIDIIQADFYAN